MNSGHDNHHQVTTPNPVNESVNSWKEFMKLTMVNQESVFKYQLEELHRIYRKQVEMMEEIGTKRSHGHLKYTRKRSKKPKLTLEDKMVNLNDTDAPVTPETTNRTIARGKQVVREDKHARSAAETLVAMSSSLLRASSDRLVSFAKIVTSVKRGADLASSQHKMQMPGGKKRKGMRAGPCVSGWGKIKNGRRSKRIRASNPIYTYQRGAFLCRWR